MPARSLPVTEHASRVLLERIVDYAGLFPPAAESMSRAVRAYAHYRASGDGWMLGRFVCPAAALEQFSVAAEAFLPRDAGAIPWTLAVTGSGDVAADMRSIAAFNVRHRVCFDDNGAIVDSYEAKAESAQDIRRIADAALPTLATYVEIPLLASFPVQQAMVEAVARAALKAKLRTGGLTQDAFPSADAILSLLGECIAHGVAAKATAGLHHPLRGFYPLAYDHEAATGAMFGYLNVFLAAAGLVYGYTHADMRVLLHESDPSSIEVNDLQVAWRGPDRLLAFERGLLQRTREHTLLSFGSCSFREPVDEVRALGFF